MNIIQVVLPIFLIIGLGALFGKLKKINLDPLVSIIMYIAAPCLVISSLQESNLGIKDFSTMAIYTCIVIMCLWLVSSLIIKYSKIKEKGLQIPMIFGNTGYLGFPVALFAFGALGLSQAVIYSSVETILLMSLGIYLAHHKNDFREIFKIPLIYAVIIGVFFSMISYKIPEIVFTPINMIGQITIPLALMILGYRLTEIKVTSFKKAILASIFKMGFGLIIALAIISIFSVTGIIKNVLLIQAAMPSAVLTMVICHKYNRDSDLVASVVFVSTLLSIVTIPLILMFL